MLMERPAGISIVDAEDILIDHVRITNGRRAGIDLEPNTSNNVVRGVEIRNSYTNTHLFAFASMGRSEVSDIYIHDNTINNSGIPIVYVNASDQTRRYDWTFTDNVSSVGWLSRSRLALPIGDERAGRWEHHPDRQRPRAARRSPSRGALGTLQVTNNDFLNGGCYISAVDSGPIDAHDNQLGCP